jgi:Pyruvate/2-oxoacid:ferredoxin oxidoreductase gamma subunit
MVMLGAFLKATKSLNSESILEGLSAHGFRQELVDVNRNALQAGEGLVE